MSTFFLRCLPLEQRFGRIVGETNAHAGVAQSARSCGSVPVLASMIAINNIYTAWKRLCLDSATYCCLQMQKEYVLVGNDCA